jgi:hypothetical protein
MRQALRALQRAVGHREVRRRLRGKMRGAQLDHVARADEQHLLVLQAREDARRELHRRRRHRHARRADAGGAAHLLGDGEGALEEPVQHRAERAGGLGGARGLLHLAEDLRLAEHHGIQARGDTEGMAHRLLARQRVQVALQLVALQPVVLRHPVGHLGRRALCRDVQLGAVAGGEDRRLGGEAAPDLGQRVAQPLDVEHHALAHCEGRGVVIQTEREKRHAILT